MHEVQKQEWAGKMKQALQAMLVAVTEAKARGETSLSAEEIARWKASYQAMVQEGEEAHPRPPGQDANAPPPCKGRRPKQSPARNVLDRLITYQDAILTFLSNFAVPFDNSQAERDVRMVKVQQKVSGSCRSEAGAHAFCRIRGYLSTDAANKADIC